MARAFCPQPVTVKLVGRITPTKPGGGTIGTHSYTYDPLGNIATWKREAPLANPTGPTHQFTSAAYYDMANQVISVGNTPLPVSFTFGTPSAPDSSTAWPPTPLQ